MSSDPGPRADVGPVEQRIVDTPGVRFDQVRPIGRPLTPGGRQSPERG